MRTLQEKSPDTINHTDGETGGRHPAEPPHIDHYHGRAAAKTTMAKITARMRRMKQAFFLAFFWCLLALRSSTLAPLVSFVTFSTFSAMRSSWPPCSCTICATSRNSSFSSLTLCSMFRISASRSMINASWKSTSSWFASRGSSSCCCCCWASADGAVRPASSRAVRAAIVEARCFSRARRWTAWNSSRVDLNSDDSFCCVHFWAG